MQNGEEVFKGVQDREYALACIQELLANLVEPGVEGLDVKVGILADALQRTLDDLHEALNAIEEGFELVPKSREVNHQTN